MSYDLLLDSICDHRVHREPYYVDWDNDKDLRTIRVYQPVTNPNDIRLWKNDVVFLPDDPQYGWHVEADEFSVPPDRKVKIILKHPVTSYFDYFELSYTVRSGLCRKCLGLGIVFDYAVDRSGNYIKIFQENKLMQQIIKMVITLRGSNPPFKFYGTNIPEIIFQAIRSPGVFERIAQGQILEGAQRIKNIHFQQSAIPGQAMDIREILNTVNGVTVVQDKEDPRVFRILIDATTAAGSAIELQRELIVNNDSMLSTVPRRAAGV